MSKLRNSSVQRNIDPTDQLISAETIQFPAQEEYKEDYTVTLTLGFRRGPQAVEVRFRNPHGDVVV